MLYTRVCEILGIRHPVIQAGMSVHTNSELVAAVSNAGGLGLVGTVFRDMDSLVEVVEATRRLTRQPFGANVVLAERSAEIVEYLIQARVPAIATSWGDPSRIIEQAHAAGLKTLHQVQTADEATRVAETGVDIIIAQGSEGGGHVGQVGTIAIVPAVVDAVAGRVPVVAAGGIADGRGLAAAIALGAEGVLIGTRFLATTEAGILDSWKQAIIDATGEDAWQTDIPDLVGGNHWPGATVRVLANTLLRSWRGREREIPDERERIAAGLEEALQRNDAERLFLYAGQSAGLIHDIVPAGEIVERIVVEAAAILKDRAVFVDAIPPARE